MLIDENDSNIFSFLGEVLERFLNRRGFGLRVYHEEIPLGVGGVCDML